MLAAKRAEEAERLVGLFQVAASAVRITEAAGDVARIVLEDGGVPAAFEHAFPEADERLVRAVVADESDLAGERLRDLELDLEEGVRLIAIRRDGEWAFSPDGDDRLEAGDVIVGRGPREGIETVYRRATGSGFSAPPESPETSVDLERAAEAVVELKDMAELAVGLGYGAARFDSDELAREVRSLEEQSNARKAALETWVIEVGGDWDADELRGLLHLAAASEEICDAAVDVAEVVPREVELPPVFGAALEDSEEVIASVTVGRGSDLDGTTIASLEFEEGDSLLVRGPPAGLEHLRDLADDERDGEADR